MGENERTLIDVIFETIAFDRRVKTLGKLFYETSCEILVAEERDDRWTNRCLASNAMSQ